MKKHTLALLFVCTLATLGCADSAQAAEGFYNSFPSSYSSFNIVPAYSPVARRTRSLVRYAPVTPAALDSRVHPKLIAAARIAYQSAQRHSQLRCWRYVKKALLSAGAVSSYPGTNYAKQAGAELTSKYGFKRLSVRSPYKAPVGSVLVYGGRGAGHVELRTSRGFASDYRSPYPAALPFLGAYIKSV